MPGSQLRRSASVGFTLIEVLVVIVIVSVLAGAVVWTINPGDPSRKVRTEAQRLRAVLHLATEDALFQGRDIGVELFENGYRFLVWDYGLAAAQAQAQTAQSQVQVQQANNAATAKAKAPKPHWELITHEPALREYQMPEGVRLRVEVDDARINTQQTRIRNKDNPLTGSDMDKAREEKKPVYSPVLYILSNGEVTPYSIEVFHEETPEQATVVKGNFFGDVEIERPDEDER